MRLPGQQDTSPSAQLDARPMVSNLYTNLQYRLPPINPNAERPGMLPPYGMIAAVRNADDSFDTVHTVESPVPSLIGSEESLISKTSPALSLQDRVSGVKSVQCHHRKMRAVGKDKATRAKKDRIRISESVQMIHDTLIILCDYRPVKEQSKSNSFTSGLLANKDSLLRTVAVLLDRVLSRLKVKATLKESDAVALMDWIRWDLEELSNNDVLKDRCGELGLDSTMRGVDNRECAPARTATSTMDKYACTTHTSKEDRENSKDKDGIAKYWLCRIALRRDNHEKNFPSLVEAEKRRRKRKRRLEDGLQCSSHLESPDRAVSHPRQAT